jgi:energy-coupling factor transporter ATP-binding protein EcfA2
MKVTIQNLGILQHAEIELKPLTVFIGLNGTGKTWTAHTLSAILGPYGYSKYLKAYLTGKVAQTYPPLQAAMTKLLEQGSVQLDILQFADDYLETYVNDVAMLAPTWMRSFLATNRVNFDRLQVSFQLATTKAECLAKIKTATIDRQLGVGRDKALLHALKEAGNATIHFYSEGDSLEKLPPKAFKLFIVGEVFKLFHRSFFTGLYVLPTERTTFITFPISTAAKEEIGIQDNFAETVQTEVEKHGERLTGAIQHFLTMTAIATRIEGSADRQDQIRENPDLQKFVKLADFLEQEILRGSLQFETDAVGRKKLLFQYAKEARLEMPIASSMVKELAPLALYLRYLATPGEWLIFDEPEMNLHPALQVELMEFLGMLVNAGLQVLITTHSPYLVDHLVNLIQATKYPDNENIKEFFYLEQLHAFLVRSQVSAYLFKADEGSEKVTVRNILTEDGLMDWETFSNVSEDVSAIYSQLL